MSETYKNDVIYRLEHVSKVYGGSNKVAALDDVSLNINRGDIYGIIGMSGAGKSTLVRTLNRLEDVTEGKVYFEERDLKELSAKELRKARQSAGMIFQGFNLLNRKTVGDNIRIALKIAGIKKDKHEEITDRMLKIVGLEDKKHAYPSELSGGQKQRVAIARALSTDPKVILCDEATSALDPKITSEILELLKKINKELGVTVVMITHEMSVVEAVCNRVAVIDRGKLAEEGKVTDIFVNPRSDAARRLVYPERTGVNLFDGQGRKCVRLVFDGTEAKEPIIARLASSKGIEVSILSANTKSVGGVGFGQMIVALPEDEKKSLEAEEYFRETGVYGEEVTSWQG
ncbi:MAG: ATP-binding cassette domain-containing protein [Lachnospiraceae bacterium]|nr:ATP-binding cassette domain-containing protein [Lachnospiraceae bacterium]